jgi:hypothetical protein
MNEQQMESLLAYAESSTNATLMLKTTLDALLTRVDAEFAELRDGLIELDHKLAATRQETAALDDAVSVLRNDYRGEAA